MSEEGHEERDGREEPPRGEMLKFAILVLILAVTVALVAVARPLIFDGLVPAVLGWDGQPAEGVTPTAAPTETPAGVEESVTPVAPTATATTTPVPPTATPRVHVVQAGENLTEIGQRYGVTVEAIMEANGLANANRIFPGQRLLIPDS